MIKLYLIFDSLIDYKANKTQEAAERVFNALSVLAPVDKWKHSYPSVKEAYKYLLFNSKYQLIESDLYKFQTDAYKINSDIDKYVKAESLRQG